MALELPMRWSRPVSGRIGAALEAGRVHNSANSTASRCQSWGVDPEETLKYNPNGSIPGHIHTYRAESKAVRLLPTTSTLEYGAKALAVLTENAPLQAHGIVVY